MAALQVFVSYSHKDARALQRLQTALAPYKRQLTIDLWDDTRLRGGDLWLREIEAALAAAQVGILIVSADFLASDFIVGSEVPPLLRKAASGGLTLLPIFWAPSGARTLDFTLPDGQETRQLADFEGFGRPDKALLELPNIKREKEFQRLAERLLELAGSPASSAPTPSRSAPISGGSFRPAAAEPARLFELTVELRHAGERIEARHIRPGGETLGETRRPWADFAGPLAELSRTLSGGAERALTDWLETAPRTTGAVLFRLLFGEAAEWGPLLRKLFGAREDEVQPNPIRHPVRVRIATADPLLLALPWRTTAWDRRVLAHDGWTFETTSVAEPTRDVSSSAPFPVLVVTESSDPLPSQAVLEVLRAAWGSFREDDLFLTVRSRRELENAVAGMRPHLLYLQGGEPFVPLAELPGMFHRTGQIPAAVVLELSGLGKEGVPSPPEIFGAAIPLLLWRRLPEPGADVARLALTWLRRWLGGDEPVTALHKVADESFRGSPEGATLGVHTNHRSWSTTRPHTRTAGGGPLLKLDRTAQKALVVREIQNLVRNDAARALALVAYAAPGNELGALAKQLQHDLELEVEREAALRWYAPKFPLQRQTLEEFLEGELRLHLDSYPEEPPRHLLQRCAPRVIAPGRRAVLWFDWGTFGESQGKAAGLEPPLTKAHLKAWMLFSSSFLAVRCPADVRVVSYLAIESREKHERLTGFLHDCENEPFCQIPEFSLTPLPPLSSVSESDLRKYLRDPNHLCPVEYQGEIARLVARTTGGEFDKAYRLLEEGEGGSWLALLTRLRGDSRSSSPDDDEIL